MTKPDLQKEYISVNNEIFESNAKTRRAIERHYSFNTSGRTTLLEEQERISKICEFIRKNGKKILEVSNMFRDD